MTLSHIDPRRDGISDLEEVSSDRRRDIRFITVSRPVKVEHEGDEGLGRCRDISDGGAKLELHMELDLNERVRIAFSPTEVVSGKIVWTNGDDYGVAFDASVDCLEMLSGRPRALRLGTGIPPAHAGGTSLMTPSDAAERPMEVARSGRFEPGLRVRVMMEGGQEREGVVRWSRDNIAGIMLFDPFAVEGPGSTMRLSMHRMN